MKIKQDFGRIYSGKNPTHGVYAEDALNTNRGAAVAKSHHWSRESAEIAAKKEAAIHRRNFTVVEYV